MLKGTVTFETFENGKLIQKESAENMVTDAVDKILALSPWYANHVKTKFPIAQNILGGLFLFDNPLSAQATNICFPGSEAKLVGMGGRLTDNQDPIRGTFDDVVSGPIENGYKSVWKFTEDQANGRISSASLTCKEAGAGFWFRLGASITPPRDLENLDGLRAKGWFGPLNGNYNWGAGCVPLIYDEQTHMFYYGVISGNQAANYSFDIYKRYLPLFDYGVNDGGDNGSIDILYPAERIGAVTGHDINFRNAINGYDGYLYVYNGVRVQENTKIYIGSLYRLKLSDLKNDTITFSSYGTDIVYEMGTYIGSTNPSITINKGYVYLTSSYGPSVKTRRYVLKEHPLPSGDTESYIEYTDGVNGYKKNAIESSYHLFNFENGVVAETISSTEQNVPRYVNLLYNDATGNAVRVPINYNYTEEYTTHRMDLGILRFYTSANEYTMSAFIMQEYLGTIFNLSTPVNKDTSKTMTVTYTLTNVTENS